MNSYFLIYEFISGGAMCEVLPSLMEMNVRNEERAKVEKNQKIRLQLQAAEEKALALLEQGKTVNLLSVADLDVLFAWHQTSKTKGAKKADKLQQ